MARHPSTEQLLGFFSYKHLQSDRLVDVSIRFYQLAHELVEILPDGPELTVALRKLLESKDSAVRHAAFTLKED